MGQPGRHVLVVTMPEQCGHDPGADPFDQPADEPIPQVTKSRDLFTSPPHSGLDRGRERGGSGHIRGAGPPAPLLTSAEDLGTELDSLAHEERAGADRPSDLVTGDRHEIDVCGGRREVDPAQGLYGIGVKPRAGCVLAHDRRKRGKVIDGTGLVVDSDDRHDRDVVVAAEHAGQGIGRDLPAFVEPDNGAPRVLDRLQHGVMFTSRTDGPAAPNREHAPHGEVVGLGTTAREHNLGRWPTESGSHDVTGIVEGPAGIAGGLVSARRVGVVGLGRSQPGRPRLGPHHGARRVIEVDLGTLHDRSLRTRAASASGPIPRCHHRTMGQGRLGHDAGVRTAQLRRDGFADVYDDWYADVSDVEATVAAVAALASGRPVLELGVGTGRLAIPLAGRGLDVVGIDASAAMIEVLSAKDGGRAVRTVVADMADLPVENGHFGVVFAAFNTFFNLTDGAARARCARRVHEVLAPGGAFLIEGFVPPADGLTDGGISVRNLTTERVVLSVSRHDPDSQIIEGQHVDITAEGIVMRPWALHYRTPAQLDELLSAEGFGLESRSADWTGAPFEPGADTHVSIYRRID